MRTSSGTPPQKGCVLTSSRPASKSKPKSRMTCSHSTRCAASGKGPTAATTGSAAWRAVTCWIRPGSHCRTSPNTRSTWAQVMPGSKRSIIASYFRTPFSCDSSSACSRPAASTSRKFSTKPFQSLAGRCVRQACSQRDVAICWRCTSDSGSAFDARHWRRISRTLARCRSVSGSCSARDNWSGSLASVRMRCSSAAISANAAARASLPLGGMLAAWSQPAMDCRCDRRCSRVQVPARSS